MPVTEKVRPNPYLNHIPERDILTPSGKMLTLHNPATMIRELNRTQEELFGALSRITALQVLNPINMPDEWEKKALLIIQKNKEDYTEITEIEGKPYLRKMQPMIMEEGCLKCHAWTKIPVGGIRGGTDFSVALEPYFKIYHQSRLELFLSHLSIWILGIGIIYIFGKRQVVIETELLKTEEEVQKLLTAIEQSPTTIVITDTDGNIQYANPHFSLLTGYSAKEVKGLNPRILNSGFTPRSVYKDLWNSLSNGRTWSGEFINRKKNGEIFYEQAYIAPRDFNGTIINYVAVKLDISERRNLELNLIQSREEAIHANQVKSNFLAMITHEIRTPIHAMMGFTDVLFANHPKPEQLIPLQNMRESGKHLLDIIDSILSIADLENQKLSLNESEFSISELLDELKSEYHSRIIAKGLEFKYSIQTNTGEWVVSDRVKIQKILKNLISNAIKFTESGKIILEVQSTELLENQANWTLSVIDSGKGIPQNHVDSIFDLFTQEDSSISRKYGGLGLGLVICKKYADLLGGDILVESKEKQGSKFSLNFSCKTFNKDLNSISTNPLAWEKIKTLIVEDDILNTLILENFLQEIGFERIDTAEDGAIGWEKIQTEDYDLVITDLHMPNLDGYQLAKKIFQRDSKCPKVIAASADAYEETRKKCFDMGMLAFIPKPFSLKQIKNVIEKVL